MRQKTRSRPAAPEVPASRGRGDRPALSVAQILAWAEAHRARTGHWPQRLSGVVGEAPGETWLAVDTALRFGQRGLPGASSLPRLLRAHCSGAVADLVDERQNAEDAGTRRRQRPPDLEIEQILAWADAHQARTGRWPDKTSRPIHGAPGEKWSCISEALHRGYRGLAPGSSLARLLDEHRGVRNLKAAPPLTGEQILAWADEHRARTGRAVPRWRGCSEDSGRRRLTLSLVGKETHRGQTRSAPFRSRR